MKHNFTEYLLEFYGHNGIYDYGFTASEIQLVTQLYKTRLDTKVPFVGDSIDRERVRDIVLAYRAEQELV